MFGTFKVNGNKVVRQVTADQAQPGFLVIVSMGSKDSRTVTKVGDLVLKTTTGKFVRIHENPAILSWSSPELVVVQYADVELTYSAVKEE